jgi:innexin
MERLIKSMLTIREVKYRMDDDYVDRLNRQYTVIILICFSALVSTKQIVGRPITCWCPAQFTDSHREYADSICWVSNTYYLPMDETIPGETLLTHKSPAMISYYQWVPLVLLFQALLAFLPCMVWRFLNRRSGVNMTGVMDAARVCSQASYIEIREKVSKFDGRFARA